MVDKRLSISDFFKKVLGAPLKNARWSWGAVNPRTRQVFLRVWKDERDTVHGVDRIHIFGPDWGRSSPGGPERRSHVQLIRSGAEGYGVLCVAKDPKTTGSRIIESFDDQRLLQFGPLVEVKGNVYATIVQPIPVGQIASAESVDMVKRVAAAMTADDVLAAFRQLDEGVQHPFGPSIDYDVVFRNGHYPPKAVFGLAAQRLAGRGLTPNEFQAGPGKPCFRTLERLGFKPVLKRSKAATGDREPRTTYWWVNHKQTFRQEIDGEYLWSPKTNQNGAKNESYNNMTRVLPGDVVFSFADAAIRAVGVALGRAREAPKPREFGATGDQWGSDPGWQVPVRFRELSNPLRPKAHASELASVLPAKHSPIRASGDGNQGVYLAAVPGTMAAKLRELLGGQFEQVLESITQTTDGRLTEDAAEERIQQRTDIGPTEKLNLVKSRRGQGVFRENLEQIEKKCRVTGVLDRRHLRASHIKPWNVCDDREKLDGFNGLLLSPHVDHLFDRGYISFSDAGDLLVSKDLNRAVLESWGISLPHNVGSFRQEQRRYLEYHRAEVFEQLNSGRRGSSAGGTEKPEVAVQGEPVVVRPR
jgi:putative restriction endonuclease